MNARDCWLSYTSKDAKNPHILMATMKFNEGHSTSYCLEVMWELLREGKLELTANRWIRKREEISSH